MAVTTIGSAGGSGLQQYEQIFSTSGTWTKPNGVKTVELIMAGGGATSYNQYGVGGAGSVWRGIVDVSALSTVPVTVGAGGIYGISNAAANGGNSSFGSLVVCTGGVAPLSNGYAGTSGQWYLPTTAGSTIIYPAAATGTTTGTTANEIDNAGNGALKWNGSYYLQIIYAGGSVKKSTDGITWSTVASISMSGSTYNNKLEWGNGQWVFVGGQSTYLTSPDGVTWTSRTLPGSQASAMAISYANGKWWLAGGSNLTLYSSTDAISWTSVSVNFNGYAATAGRVAYGNGVYVCVPTGNTGGWVSYSSDGTTWNTSSTGYNYNWLSNAVFNGSVFFIGSSGSTAVTVSSNGSTWSTNFSVPGAGVGDMFVASGGVVFIGSSTGTSIGYSADNGKSLVVLQSAYSMRGVAGPNNSFTFYTHQNTPYNYWRGGTYLGSVAVPGYTAGSTGPAAGGSAGGQPVMYGSSTYLYPGLRFEGYGMGGNQGQTPLFPGDGSYYNVTPQNGIVKVRWWA